jgi:hypothetical protein
MGVFDKVTSFFSKPAVRIGLGVASAAGGAGLFDSFDNSDEGGTDWSNVLTTGAGLGNLVSAASAGDAWSIPQAALGGYGVLQKNKIGGVGNFGTFGQSYDRVMQAPSGFGSGVSAFFGGQQPSQTALQAPSYNYNLVRRPSQLDNPPSNERYGGGPPPPSWSDDSVTYEPRPVESGSPMTGGNSGGKFDTNAARARLNRGPLAPGTYADGTSYQGKNGLLNTQRLSSSGDVITGNDGGTTTLSGGGEAIDRLSSSDYMSGLQPGYLNQGINTDIDSSISQKVSGVPSAHIGQSAVRRISEQVERNTQKAASKDFKGFMENVFQKAMDKPLATLSIANAIMTSFTDTRDEDAASAYATEMAYYRQRLDPSSGFAQEWQGAYIQDKEDELNKHFAKAEADFTATMARRGMTDSTVAASGRASLAKAKAKLKVNIKSDAYQAYANYQRSLMQAEAYAGKNALAAANVARGSGSIFQNASAAAVKSIV